MSTPTVIKLDTTELDRIASRLNITMERCLARFAFDVEGEAKMLAPHDTTAMRNSIYTVTKTENHFSEASSAAKGARPGVETEAHPSPDGQVIAYVGPCVEYTEYVELGTSRMAAKPFLLPALEHKAAALNDESMWEEMFK